jgi:hypothetical protein
VAERTIFWGPDFLSSLVMTGSWPKRIRIKRTMWRVVLGTNVTGYYTYSCIKAKIVPLLPKELLFLTDKKKDCMHTF